MKNAYIARCACVLAWSYLAGSSPEQLVIDIFCTASAICCMLYIGGFVNNLDNFMDKSLKICLRAGQIFSFLLQFVMAEVKFRGLSWPQKTRM